MDYNFYPGGRRKLSEAKSRPERRERKLSEAKSLTKLRLSEQARPQRRERKSTFAEATVDKEKEKRERRKEKGEREIQAAYNQFT